MDNMERRQNEELLEARRLRRQEQKRRLLMRQRVLVNCRPSRTRLSTLPPSATL